MRLYGQTFGKIGDFEDANGKRYTWIQVFKTGSFIHPKIGDLNVGEQDLEQFVKNFNNKVHKTQPSLNLNHKREEAAGWFVGLETRKSGRELWAKIEWTDFGIEKVEKGLFRYISAELSFKHLDTETKEVSNNVLTGAALTNHPFIKGMEAVNFSEAFPNETLLLETTKKEAKPMNKTELIAALAALGIDFHEMERKANLYDTQTVDFQALQTSSKSVEAELSETKTKLTTATARVTELEKIQIDAQFNDLVKEGMEAGKITKAYGEGDFRELFDKMGYDFAKKHMEAMPKSVTTDFSGSNKGGNSSEKGDANDVLLDAAKALQVERKLDFSEAMDALGKERPELFEAAEALANKTVGDKK
jgi:phage I-like protein